MDVFAASAAYRRARRVPFTPIKHQNRIRNLSATTLR
jgi:hypothetical protein